MRIILESSMIAATLIVIFGSALYAQSATTPAPSPQTGCSPATNIGPRPNDTTGDPALGERLAESKAVICPPSGLDPGVSVAPKLGEGRTPVIPPLGTPRATPPLRPDRLERDAFSFNSLPLDYH